MAIKAAQAAAVAAAAQQQQKQEKELLWEDQACTRCGSKVGRDAMRPPPPDAVLLPSSDMCGNRWECADVKCHVAHHQLQEDGPDTEEGLMLLCDGCNKGTHMRCVPADLSHVC